MGDQIHVRKVGSSRIEVGRFTYGHQKVRVLQWGEGSSLKIGAFCSLAAGLVVILGGNHRVDWGTTFPFGHIFSDELGGKEIVGHPTSKGDVLIGNDVWIGTSVTLMSGISIGSGAVVAANSNVSKDIPPYEVWGGNPARFIKKRFDDAIVERFLEIAWWDFPTQVVRECAPLLSRPPTLEVLGEIEAIANRAKATEAPNSA